MPALVANEAPGLSREPHAGLSLDAAWWGVVAVFLVHGLVVSTWVSRIASVKKGLQLGDGALGMALLGSAIGSLMAIPICGWSVAKFGARRTVQWTACGFAISLLPLALAPSLTLLTAGLVFYGAMAGANDVAINAQAVAVEKRLGTPTMSRFHAMFSLGGIGGAAAGAFIASAAVRPVVHFVVVSLLLLAGIGAVKQLLADYRETPSKVAPQGRAQGLPPALLILSAIGFCIFLAEGAIADWTSVYISEVLHAGDGFAAAGYAVFSAAMTVFRFAGDRITARLGRARTIRAGALLAACGLLAVVTAGGPASALAGFAAAGAGFSSIIPLVFAAAGRISSYSEAAGVATVSGIGYLGFLCGPPAIGFVSEMSSLRAGLTVLVVLCTASAILITVLQRVSGPDDSPLR